MMADSTMTFETELLSDLRRLPPDKVREILDFVEYLKEKYATKGGEEPPSPPRGSAEALLRHAGVWERSPDEIEEFNRWIDITRHMEWER